MRKRFILQPWMILVALVLLFVISIFATYFVTRERTGTELALGNAASAVQQGTAQSAGGMKGFFQRLFATRDQDAEYEELKNRVIALETQLHLMEELQRENERLNALLGFQQTVQEYTYIPAKVITAEPGSWFLTFNLDKGTKQGVAVDMAVVNADGLVGRVTEVGRNWCKVLCIIDPNCAVAAMVERTRDQGVIKGATDPESATPLCQVYYLTNTNELVPGDVILTSNLGGVYPKGIPVGRVQEVGRNEENQSYAVIAPAVDFAHLENVMIIQGERPSDFEAQDDAAAAGDTP